MKKRKKKYLGAFEQSVAEVQKSFYTADVINCWKDKVSGDGDEQRENKKGTQLTSRSADTTFMFFPTGSVSSSSCSPTKHSCMACSNTCSAYSPNE